MANEPYRLTQTGEEVQADLNDIEALGLATEETAGKMSAADKQKLDALPSGAELEGSLGGKVDKVPGKGLSENDYTDAEKDKVALLSSDSAVVDARLADTLVGQPNSIVLQVKRKSGSTTTITEFDLASYYVQKEQGKGLVSDAEKATWNGKYSKPSTGIPKTDLESAVQTSLGKADSALQSQKQADWNEADSNDPAYIKNKPTIPAGVTVDQTYDATSQNAQSGVAMAGALAGKQDTISDLSTIRTGAAAGATAVQPEAGKGLFSGNYNDLSNKPTIPDAQVQANWNESDSASKAYIQNKPSIPAAQVNSDWNASSGVAQILNKPTIPDAQIQSDWNQSDNTAKDYIKNKPSIPAAQVNSDWNANSGVAQILNKPAIPDAVEANPTVPSGTTPTDLQNLKVGSNYYGIPALPSVDNTPTASSNNLVKSGGVYSEVHPAVGSSQPAGGMLPNKFYALGTLTGSVTIAFATPTDNNIENEYKFGFTAGSTAPTIQWPNGIIWAGNCLDDTTHLPEIDADTYYEVSVQNSKGIIAKFL